MEKLVLSFGSDYRNDRREKFVERIITAAYAAAGVGKRFLASIKRRSNGKLTLDWFNEASDYPCMLSILLPDKCTFNEDFRKILSVRPDKSWAMEILDDTVDSFPGSSVAVITRYSDIQRDFAFTNFEFECDGVCLRIPGSGDADFYMYLAADFFKAMADRWSVGGLERVECSFE